MNKMIRGIGIFSLTLFVGLTAGCGGKGGGAGQNNSDGGQPPQNLIGAPGVSITEVAIFQGPKCQIMINGQARDCGIPLVQGRDALLRVYYTSGVSQGVPYTARLTINQTEVYTVTGSFGTHSSEDNLASTASFIIPGDTLTGVFSYQVELLTEGRDSDDNPEARFPQQGAQQVPVAGNRNTIRLIVAPFEYNADGSGRLPTLTPQRIQEFEDRFRQLYPVSDAVITVRAAYPWSSVISPDGSGWQQVGMTLLNFRNQDGTSDDVYYYGIFNPAASFSQFCGMGCLLGVTLLNDNPPDTGSVDLRLALGVGFDEVAVDTMAHEIGHSHGRRHAPCGPGVQDVDPAYPYAGGLIGVWSWDIINLELKAPDQFTDIMGYCDDQWISDYMYIGLHNRSQNVNLPWIRQPGVEKVEYQLITVDGDGVGIIREGTQRSVRLAGIPTETFVSSKEGLTTTKTGQYFFFDHLPGGWLLVPKPDFEMHTAEFVTEGRWTFANLERAAH